MIGGGGGTYFLWSRAQYFHCIVSHYHCHVCVVVVLDINIIDKHLCNALELLFALILSLLILGP